MDNNNDDVSFDFNKLADSLRGEFETLYPLSKHCCIYRVPPKLRMLSESLYTPKMVSIGPLHHGREELKSMKEHKLRFLQQFLQRTSVSMEDFLKFIKGKEVDLRNCYAETIKFSSEDFVKMILIDVAFLIEILLGSIPGFDSMDCVFTRPGMIKEIMFDIMTLENQLPIFILDDMFKLANPAMPSQRYEGCSLSKFTRAFFACYICADLLIDETLIDLYFLESKHFIDLLRLCLQPPERVDIERQTDSEAAPNVTRLHMAGIKIKFATTINLLDIRFDKGTLKIPKLTLGNMTIHLLRNLQIFEALHSHTNYINDYIVFLNRLLSAPKDVELLTDIEVIQNRILDSERVQTFFREFSRDARVQYSNFYYSGLVKDLQDYCTSPDKIWKAELRQHYFNTPWTALNVVQIFIILLLTLIQTVCSVLGLK